MSEMIQAYVNHDKGFYGHDSDGARKFYKKGDVVSVTPRQLKTFGERLSTVDQVRAEAARLSQEADAAEKAAQQPGQPAIQKVPAQGQQAK